MSEHDVHDGLKGAMDEVEHAFLEAESVVERFIYSRRLWVLLAFLVITVYLVSAAIKVRPDASFEKMVPIKHPYIAAYLERKDELTGLGNAVRISIETTEGDIFSAEYMETLRQISDEVFFIPGVDRTQVSSLFTPNVRFTEVVEDGIAGGNVVPADFQPTPEGLAQVRKNILKAGIVGRLVANDFQGAMISAELLEFNPNTGESLDYIFVARELEEKISTLEKERDTINERMNLRFF